MDIDDTDENRLRLVELLLADEDVAEIRPPYKVPICSSPKFYSTMGMPALKSTSASLLAPVPVRTRAQLRIDESCFHKSKQTDLE